MTTKPKRNPKAPRTERAIRADLKFERGMRAAERRRLQGMKGEGRAMHKSLMAITQETIGELEAELAAKRARIAATPRRTKPTGVLRRRAGVTTALRNVGVTWEKFRDRTDLGFGYEYYDAARAWVGDSYIRIVIDKANKSYPWTIFNPDASAAVEDKHSAGHSTSLAAAKRDSLQAARKIEGIVRREEEARSQKRNTPKAKRTSSVARNYFDLSVPNSKLGG